MICIKKSRDSIVNTPALYERIIKNQAVLSTLIGNDHFKYLNDEIISNTLWAARSLAKESEALLKALGEAQKREQ